MASMKYSLVLSVAVLLSSSGVVQGQNRAACLYDDLGAATLTDVPTGESGNYLRTYENICNKRSNGEALDSPVTYAANAPTFVKFCAFLEQAGNSNVFDYIAKGTNPHTLFAPTDAAFDAIATALTRFTTTQVRKILELHVIPETKLLSQLECNSFELTLNTENNRANQQRSKTKCLTGASTAQIGPGNVPFSGNGRNPVIGNPTNVFRVEDFGLTQADNFIFTVNNDAEFSQDIVACNGIIQVVDNVLLPGNEFLPSSAKGGKAFGPPKKVGPRPQGGSFFADNPFFGKNFKAGKSGKSGKRRELFDDFDDDEDYEEGTNNGGGDDVEDKEDESGSARIRENRRQRLLELLIEPTGDVAPLN